MTSAQFFGGAPIIPIPVIKGDDNSATNIVTAFQCCDELADRDDDEIALEKRQEVAKASRVVGDRIADITIVNSVEYDDDCPIAKKRTVEPRAERKPTENGLDPSPSFSCSSTLLCSHRTSQFSEGARLRTPVGPGPGLVVRSFLIVSVADSRHCFDKHHYTLRAQDLAAVPVKVYEWEMMRDQRNTESRRMYVPASARISERSSSIACRASWL